MPPPEVRDGLPTVSPAGPGSSAPTPPLSEAPTAVSEALAVMTAEPVTTRPASDRDSASVVCNLLPSLGVLQDPAGFAGVYVGEGLLPVPAKLAEKIVKWEFVDMGELLPEFWAAATSKDASNPKAPASRRKRAVTDIASWTQCFATYTSVMSTAHPKAVPELLAYLIFILRASQDYGGVAWVTYDAAFRRQAFITGNRLWSKINPSLYSICFAGSARTGIRCELCLSLSHSTRDCSLVGDQELDVPARLKTLESAVLGFTSSTSQQQVSTPRARAMEICRNWNLGRCRMQQCRFRHACRICGGPNPAFACCDRSLGPRVDPNQQPLGQTAPTGPAPMTSFNRSRPGPGPERFTRARPGIPPY